MGEVVHGNANPEFWFPGVNGGVWGAQINAGQAFFDDELGQTYPERRKMWSPLVKYLWLVSPNGLPDEKNGAALVKRWKEAEAEVLEAYPARCAQYDDVPGFLGTACKLTFQTAPADAPVVVGNQIAPQLNNEISTLPPETPAPYVSPYAKADYFWGRQIAPKYGKRIADTLGFSPNNKAKAALLRGEAQFTLTLGDLTGFNFQYARWPGDFTKLQRARVSARLVSIDGVKLANLTEIPATTIKSIGAKSKVLRDRWIVDPDYVERFRVWMKAGAPDDIQSALKSSSGSSGDSDGQIAAGEGLTDDKDTQDGPDGEATAISPSMIAAGVIVAAAVVARGNKG